MTRSKLLTKELQKAYDDLREAVLELRSLETEDHYFLVNFVVNYSRWEKVIIALDKEGETIIGHRGAKTRNPILININSYEDSYVTAAKMLGLGFAQRRRLKIEKAKTKEIDPTDPLNLR